MRIQKILSLVIAGSIVTVACGESKSSLNPVAPSAVVIGAQSDEASGDEASGGDAISSATGAPKPGNGNGKDKDKDKDKEKGKDQPTAPTAPTAPGNTTPPAPSTRFGA